MVPRIAVIAGDGIGPEVTAQARKVLDAALPGTETTSYDLGADRYRRTGEVLPDTVLAELAGHDAILLGAVGDPAVPPGVLERGLLLKLRFAFDHYVNLRPASAGNVDFVVVREGTEGLYAGAGGVLHRGTPQEVATEESLNTRHGVERVVRFAFALAATRAAGPLTMVHKTNVLTHAGDLWARTFTEVAAEYPAVPTEYQHVDAAAMFLATRPQRYGVIVTDNLFGDILTDLAAAVTGGIGLAASANLNPDRTYPSMFEPVHGSAPDIAGRGTADPVAAIRSVALLLDHLGHPDRARAVETAVAAHLAARTTRAAGAELRTSEVGDEIASQIAGTTSGAALAQGTLQP